MKKKEFKVMKMKKITIKIVSFLCALVIAITIVPVGNTAYADTQVTGTERENVEKYVMDVLDVYLCYGGSLGWNQKIFNYNARRQNDIAFMNAIEKLQSQKVKNKKVLEEHPYLGEGLYKYSTKTKSILKKTRQKLFGKYYKAPVDKHGYSIIATMPGEWSNKYDEKFGLAGIKYMFPLTLKGNYVRDDAPDVGDYLTSGKVSSVVATEDGYRVTMKYTTSVYYKPKKTTTIREYTVDLKTQGKSYVIKKIAMSKIKGYDNVKKYYHIEKVINELLEDEKILNKNMKKNGKL